MLLLAYIPFRGQLFQQMIRFYLGILCGHCSRLLWQSPRIFSAREGLVFQRRISLFVSVCALLCRRIGREKCWWYNFLPLGEAKPLQSSGHILNRLPAKGRALLLHCSQQKANIFWKSLSISRIGLRKLKEVMVLGKILSKCAFHRNTASMSSRDMTPEEECFCDCCFYYCCIKSISFSQSPC